MSGISLKVFGADRVNKNIEEMIKKKIANVTEAVEVTQAFVVNDAKSIAPVLTGFLRNSISPGEVVVERDLIYGEVLADAEYASHVEFGTSRQKAQPYMVPSVMKNKNRFIARLKAALKS